MQLSKNEQNNIYGIWPFGTVRVTVRNVKSGIVRNNDHAEYRPAPANISCHVQKLK